MRHGASGVTQAKQGFLSLATTVRLRVLTFGLGGLYCLNIQFEPGTFDP
jgi:hypothetical protein